MDKPKNAVLTPCGHTFCHKCAEKFKNKNCPNCRKKVKNVVKTYE